jgi:hypothetical protein
LCKQAVNPMEEQLGLAASAGDFAAEYLEEEDG